MELKQLINNDWVQKGKFFGTNMEFCVLVKENQFQVFNSHFDFSVIGPFELMLFTSNDWVQKGKFFGTNMEFCVLVKENQFKVFNNHFDFSVIGPFEFMSIQEHY